MSINSIKEDIYCRLSENWAGLSDFCFENDPYSPSAQTPFIRLSVRLTPGTQHTLGTQGNRKFTRNSEIVVQVFTPSRTGTQKSDILIERIVEIFEAVRFGDSPIKTFAATALVIGEVEDIWHQVNVSIPFYYEETK